MQENPSAAEESTSVFANNTQNIAKTSFETSSPNVEALIAQGPKVRTTG